MDLRSGITAVRRVASEGDLEGASDQLRDLYNAAPGSRGVLQRLGKLYAAAGRHEQALEALRCLLALDPRNRAAVERAARLVLDMSRAAELPAVMARADPDVAADALDKLTDEFLRLKRYSQAQAAARYLLGMDPAKVGAMERTASALITECRPSELLSVVAAISAARPDSPHLALAEAFRNSFAMRGHFPIDPSLFAESQYKADYLLQDLFFDGSSYSELPDNPCKVSFAVSKPFIAQEGVAIDIGAGDGRYCRYLQQEFEKVYCFDPRRSSEIFAHNVDLLRSTHFRCALGDVTSEIMVHGSADEPEYGKPHKAKRFRLDDFRFDDVAYIKIDVDGSETDILAGGEDTIVRDRPLIMLRQNDERRPSNGKPQSVEWLDARGYKQVASCPRGLDLVMKYVEKTG